MAEGFADDSETSAMASRVIAFDSHEFILKPLFFPENEVEGREAEYCLLGGLHDVPIMCLMCERQFNAPSTAKDEFLKHLLEEHKIVIHKVHQVCSFSRYAAYWKSKLKENKMAAYMAVIQNHTSQSKDSPTEDYYLLSDALEEDAALRKRLHLQRLCVLLAVQEEERKRDEGVMLACLFCSHVFNGRKELFLHMWDLHNFNIGHSDNIVFVDEFLTTLQQKLENFQCLYCEKTFPDRQTLKDHMRKKQHRKLNPDNSDYDKYYLVNYLEVGKTWRELDQEEEERGRPMACGDVDESGWNDAVREDEGSPPIHCLFCAEVNREWLDMEDHMKTAHGFSLGVSPSGAQMDFYLKVKAVNYIRRQMHFGACPCCSMRFSQSEQLRAHMEAERHCRLPDDSSKWSQSQYLFSTYENDAILFYLDTSDSEGSEEDDGAAETSTTSPEHACGVGSDEEDARILLGCLLDDIQEQEAEVENTGAAAGEDERMSGQVVHL